ncbi:hypothetical protein [Mesorhizobium sp. 10J20-29]
MNATVWRSETILRRIAEVVDLVELPVMAMKRVRVMRRRLAAVTASFSRKKWVSLKFRIQARNTTTTPGPDIAELRDEGLLHKGNRRKSLCKP